MNTITDYIGEDFRELLPGERFLLDGSDTWVTPHDDDLVALIEAARSLHHEWIGGFLERYDSDIDAWDMYYVTASLEGIVCDVVPVPDRDMDAFDPDGAVDFPDRAWSVGALESYIGDEELAAWLNLDVWDPLPTVFQLDKMIVAKDGIYRPDLDYSDPGVSDDCEQKFVKAVQGIMGEL